jgi:hypothetical protein
MRAEVAPLRVAPEADNPTSLEYVRRRLRTQAGWLVVFDNAEHPDALVSWLPQGPGQVLITSRNPAWGQLAAPVEVDVFVRAEALALLRRLAPTLLEADANRIAAAMGDLPLAVAQAADVLAETGMSADEYLQALATQTVEVLSDGKPVGYPVPLAAAVRLTAERVAGEDLAAGQLLQLCALLAPKPVPVEIFTAAPTGLLAAPLATVVSSGYALRRSLGRLRRYGLAKVGPDGVQLHRLTQAIIAQLLGPDGRRINKDLAAALLVAAAPPPASDRGDPALWPRWARLLPHLLIVDPETTDDSSLRATVNRATWILLARGDARSAHDLAERLYQAWRNRLGDDHLDTLRAAHNLATAHRDLGRHMQARALNETTLASLQAVQDEIRRQEAPARRRHRPLFRRRSFLLTAGGRRTGRSAAQASGLPRCRPVSFPTACCQRICEQSVSTTAVSDDQMGQTTSGPAGGGCPDPSSPGVLRSRSVPALSAAASSRWSWACSRCSSTLPQPRSACRSCSRAARLCASAARSRASAASRSCRCTCR